MLRKTDILIIAVAAMTVGCASKPPTLQTGEDAEMSFDGLTKVDNTAMSSVWAKAGADLSGYDKIILQGAGVEFRDVSGPESGSVSATNRSSRSEFPLSEADQQRLIDTVGESFETILAQSEEFEIVEESGPDVLLVRGALLDVVSNVPPTTVGRSHIFLSRVGEATLVLEIRNSQSKEIYIRAMDRRAAERPGSAIEANSVTTWAEVRRLANRWARQLQSGLDELMAAEGPIG